MAPFKDVDDQRRRSTDWNTERTGERLVAIFCLGVLMFNPLFMSMFDGETGRSLFGMPVLFFYLFASWALLIALLAWVVEGLSNHADAASIDVNEGRRDRDDGRPW
jgi:hypothetical protein